jgi:pimeloyl-ACP methyl ester carboxylesterase
VPYPPLLCASRSRIADASTGVRVVRADERVHKVSDAYVELANRVVTASNGVHYAYRDTAADSAAVPLVLLQHFRGNLDYWDPALIAELAASRRVITFDNTGVAGSSGVTPDTIEQMGADAIAFLTALGLARVDVLGFSIGSFVAQDVALRRPSLVRRLVLAASAPKGAADMHGWAPQVITAIGEPDTAPEQYLKVFFGSCEAGLDAGRQALGRMYGRTLERDQDTDWATRLAQYDAVCSWGIPDHGALQRVTALAMPVFIACGDSDPMILPRYSHQLAGLIPGAQLSVYPDAAHGFLFQHHTTFAADVTAFLR